MGGSSGMNLNRAIGLDRSGGVNNVYDPNSPAPVVMGNGRLMGMPDPRWRSVVAQQRANPGGTAVVDNRGQGQRQMDYAVDNAGRYSAQIANARGLTGGAAASFQAGQMNAVMKEMEAEMARRKAEREAQQMRALMGLAQLGVALYGGPAAGAAMGAAPMMMGGGGPAPSFGYSQPGVGDFSGFSRYGSTTGGY